MATITKDALIKGLNEDLANEYQAIIMYLTYAASVKGMERQQLQSFFESEIADELEHAKMLANKITALGGTPVTQPAPVPVATTAREMLQNVLKAETETIQRYIERMKQAEEFGDYGLANELHEMISDETRHKEETEKLLAG